MVKPWYKQFWPWFLILLPLTVIVWTVITVIIFSKNSVSLVTEDYYKKGKGINVDISKQKIAKELGLSASVSSQNKEIVINFDKGDTAYYPALSVMFAHRTLPGKDFATMLTPDANGRYRLTTDSKIVGPWFIEITPHNNEWLIQGRVSFPSQNPTKLSN